MDSTATTGRTCEIDGADFITNSDGDATVPFGDKVDRGGTTVWVWTGDNEDEVDNETELFELAVTEADATEPATQISVTTEHGGEKAHLGKSVLYTVQLLDKNGNASKTYSNTLKFTGAVKLDSDGDPANDGILGTGDLPAWRIDPDAAPDNNPATGQYAVADGNTTENKPVGAAGPVIFSTEDGVIDGSDVLIKVEAAAKLAVVDYRGSFAYNRATVTVTDQYGDPIPGIRVHLDSSDNDSANDPTVPVPDDRYLAVGRDGSISIGYERDGKESATQTLTATIEDFDHDGDSSTDKLTSDQAATPATRRVTDGIGKVHWALEAVRDSGDTGRQIQAFDTETNTIFAGNPNDGNYTSDTSNSDPANHTTTYALYMVRYDSNDRFNIDLPDPDGAGAKPDPPIGPASYAAFEKALSKAAGYTVTWTIRGSGSRATNEFNLVVPASS